MFAEGRAGAVASTTCPLALLCHMLGPPAGPWVAGAEGMGVGELGWRAPEAASKVVLRVSPPFVWSLLVLRCLQPWLMVFIMSFCSLFTLFNVTAVHVLKQKAVHVRRRGVTSQPCFFSQVLETASPFPPHFSS